MENMDLIVAFAMSWMIELVECSTLLRHALLRKHSRNLSSSAALCRTAAKDRAICVISRHASLSTCERVSTICLYSGYLIALRNSARSVPRGFWAESRLTMSLASLIAETLSFQSKATLSENG